MRIGMVCYPSVGGSGIVATELGKQLARRGHAVHFISSEVPYRLQRFTQNVYFHQVHTPSYPLFRDSPYLISLANKIVEVARQHRLDVVHCHYAVPHATAAFLAREMLGREAPRVITTLHGTDITLMAGEPSFAEAIAFSINRSDAVTAVSQSLRRNTHELLTIEREIEVIPNFLECREFRPLPVPDLKQHLAPHGEKLILHVSNFRRVKRIDSVVRAFAQVARAMPVLLLLVGDGPDAPLASAEAQRLGVADRVLWLGTQDDLVPLLSAADLFLLPSEQESFGLAALEAMACATPVVATAVGGLPEVIQDGVEGVLCPLGDEAALGESCLRILQNLPMQEAMGVAGRKRVTTLFCADKVVPLYEDLYRRVAG